jgi:hypothetical protein
MGLSQWYSSKGQVRTVAALKLIDREPELYSTSNYIENCVKRKV